MVSGMLSKGMRLLKGSGRLALSLFVWQEYRASLADGKSPQQICDELSDLAIRLGSSDNVTIIIVQFVHENYWKQQ